MISIVTPVLNCARHVPQMLASVESQRPGPVEHILIDGGSTDGTWEILCDYCRRCTFASARQVPLLGQAAAVNLAVEMARADVIGWLNGDDMYEPGAFAEVERAFAGPERVHVFYGACAIVDGAGAPLYTAEAEPFDRTALRDDLNTIAQPAAFIRRDAFIAAGGLDPRLEYCMDYDLWLTLAAAGCNFRPIGRTLACFRLHAESKTCRRQWRFHVERARVSLRHGGGWSSPLVRESVEFLLKEPARRIATRLGWRDPLRAFLPPPR